MGRKIAFAVLIALAVAAAATASPPRHAKVMLRSTSLGSVLVDARGRTLYLFAADSKAKSACYGQCAAVWPPLLTSGTPVRAGSAKQGLLRTAKRKDGSLQVVYAGHPLYFFSGDAKAGQTKGEGIVHFGGSWYAVNAAGKRVEPASSPAPAPYPGDGSDMGNYGP
jgi:predicted lipoprotein with Yx(FWY)xxD motif